MTQTDLTVERVRHPLKMRILTVARVERIAGLLARITFTGEDLHDFVSASFDDHVKLFFPADPSQPPALPEVGPDGITFPEGMPRPAARDYTPRRFDATRQELDIGLGFLLVHRFSRLLSFLGFRPLQKRPPGIEKCLKFRWLIVGSTGSGS